MLLTDPVKGISRQIVPLSKIKAPSPPKNLDKSGLNYFLTAKVPLSGYKTFYKAFFYIQLIWKFRNFDRICQRGVILSAHNIKKSWGAIMNTDQISEVKGCESGSTGGFVKLFAHGKIVRIEGQSLNSELKLKYNKYYSLFML